MNRKAFFERLLGTSAVVAIAPSIIVKPEEPEYVTPGRYFIGSDPATRHIERGIVIDLEKIPHGFTLEDIVRIWKDHGIMIIDSNKIG